MQGKPEPLLKSIARHFYSQRGCDELCRYRFHFQNKRAGRFFAHYLKELAIKDGKTFILPEITTFHQYMRRRLHLPEVDPNNQLFVLFELFQAYKEVFTEASVASFDEFYRLGELILVDFEDLDKQMVDVRAITQNADELEELLADPSDYLDDEQQEALRRIVPILKNDERRGIMTEHFREFWAKMPMLYDRTRARLEEKGLAYEGMVYRQIAESLSSDGDDIPALTNDGVTNVFVGMNALTNAEYRILEYFKRSDPNTLFYWDYDSFLLDDNKLSGVFKRKNLRKFPDARGDVETVNHLPQVDVYAIPSSVAQGRLIGHELESIGAPLEEMINELSVAVVLPNERLLQPVLSNLPSSISKVNVTMGYPIRETPMGGMFLYLLRGIRDYYGRGERWLGTEVREIVNMSALDPLLGGSGDGVRARLNNKIVRQKKFYLNQDEIQGIVEGVESDDERALTQLLFTLPSQEGPSLTDGGWLLDYFIALITFLMEKSARESEDAMALTILFALHRILLRQKTVYDEIGSEEGNPFTFDVMSDLLRTYFNRARIPYEGEPLQGLQVMGLLETRGLDFDLIFIPDAAEGVLPTKTTSMGILPHVLRVGYGLPTSDWQNITRSYNFFRLIGRADRVVATYDSRKADTSVGEPSRYLRLLQYVYDGSGRKVSFKSANYSVKPIKTSDEGDEQLDKGMIETFQFGLLNKSESATRLSPSGITTYLTCPRKFYYQYIASLRESDTHEEIIDNAERGTLVHETLRTLYEPLVGRVLTSQDLNTLNVDEALSEAQKGVFQTNDVSGINRIYIDEACTFVLKVINKDREVVNTGNELKIIALEKEVSSSIDLPNGKSINFKGVIDRIDTINGTKRIIDYKTGSDKFDFKLSQIKVGSNELSRVATQIFTYCMVDGSEKLIPQMFQLRHKDISKPFYDVSTHKSVTAYSQVKERFEDIMKGKDPENGGILQEIIDPHNPFSACPNTNRCNYCIAKDICAGPHVK
ncbi:MAG: PD-(D/E)XK nuclease family protein [Porphyromonas sp.]|nr:PD-(D/E)XK nuclease family protein [Porphyromonas sp.]